MSNVVTSLLTADSNVGRAFPRPRTLQDVQALFSASTVRPTCFVLPLFSSKPFRLNSQALGPSNPTIFLSSQESWMSIQEFHPDMSDCFEELPHIVDLQ